MDIQELIDDKLVKRNSEIVQKAITEFLLFTIEGNDGKMRPVGETHSEYDKRALGGIAKSINDTRAFLPIIRHNNMVIVPCQLSSASMINYYKTSLWSLFCLEISQSEYRDYLLDSCVEAEKNYKDFLAQDFNKLAQDKIYIDELKDCVQHIKNSIVPTHLYAEIEKIFKDLIYHNFTGSISGIKKTEITTSWTNQHIEDENLNELIIEVPD